MNKYLLLINICEVLLCKSYDRLVAAHSSAVDWGAVQQARRSRVRFPLVSLEFFIDIILLAALWPCSYSASKRNEYKEYFLGVWRWPVHRADNLTTFMCWLSRNVGASTSLEPSGPVQACNGIAFYDRLACSIISLMFCVQTKSKELYSSFKLERKE